MRTKWTTAPRYQMRGFTLVELVVTMLIVAILAAISIPSYRQYMQRTRRADAKVELTNVAQSLERCYTRHNDYTHADCVFVAHSTQGGTYDLTLNRTAQAYTVTATAVGVQADDSGCATLTLDNLGAQDATGPDRLKCWH